MGLLVLCGSQCQNIKWICSYLAHDLPANFLCFENKCSVFLLKSAFVLTVLQEKQSSVIGVFPENVSLTRRDEMKSSFRKYFFLFPVQLGPHKTHCRLVPINVLTSSKTNKALEFFLARNAVDCL